MGKKHGFSFSSKRATGISGMKGKVSSKVGIPLTRSGLQRKVGRSVGCCIPIAFILSCTLAFIIFVKTIW